MSLSMASLTLISLDFFCKTKQWSDRIILVVVLAIHWLVTKVDFGSLRPLGPHLLDDKFLQHRLITQLRGSGILLGCQ